MASLSSVEQVVSSSTASAAAAPCVPNGTQPAAEPPACCAACGKTAATHPGVRLRLCKGCHLVRYCSAECMRADWKQDRHKPVCKAAQAAVADASGAAGLSESLSRSLLLH